MGFSTSPGKGKESSKHIEILYVDRPQFATLLLPPSSAGFYPDGILPGKTLENRTRKWGSSPPPSRGGNLADHKRLHLQSISPPIRKMAVQIDSVAFCQFTFQAADPILSLARCCGITNQVRVPIYPNFAFCHDQAMHLHVVLRAAPIHPNCRCVHHNCSG
jgi:hypothetical protein